MPAVVCITDVERIVAMIARTIMVLMLALPLVAAEPAFRPIPVRPVEPAPTKPIEEAPDECTDEELARIANLRFAPPRIPASQPNLSLPDMR